MLVATLVDVLRSFVGETREDGRKGLGNRNGLLGEQGGKFQADRGAGLYQFRRRFYRKARTGHTNTRHRLNKNRTVLEEI